MALPLCGLSTYARCPDTPKQSKPFLGHPVTLETAALTASGTAFTLPSMLVVDAPADDTKRNNNGTPLAGLPQAYLFREFAMEQAIELHREKPNNLEGKVARARAMQALGQLWLVACDRIRVMKGRGLPKSVTAANDPSRKSPKPRKPTVPLSAA
jgi:hypothetical protein